MEMMIVFSVICAVACALIGSNKKRNPFLWGVLGALFGIIALLILACLSRGTNGMKRCKKCAEYVEQDSRVCKHCGGDF